jgi:hypothetical protein
MFDASDYGYGGFIGFPSGSAALTPIKDISGSVPPDINNYIYNWGDVYNTYRATRDAFINTVGEFMIGTGGLYKELYGPDYSQAPVGITEQGRIDLADAFDDVYNKYYIHWEKDFAFWNTLELSQDKKTGQITYNFIKPYYARDRWFLDGTLPPPEPEPPNVVLYFGCYGAPYTFTVDYDQCQILTRQIYEGYINSLKELIFAIKIFIKIVTNSSFDIVNPPFDWNIPFIPPYTP